jgi:hypothetical protein
MSKKSWRNPDKVIAVTPRKFNWKSHKVFNDYESASAEKNKLIESGNSHVKINRCGPYGIKFKVKIGSAVKSEKKDVPDQQRKKKKKSRV